MNVNRWPTLEGRLSQPLTSRYEALKQMKENGDILRPLAEKEFNRCQQAHDADTLAESFTG